jgi:hypothetical protein
MIKPFTECQQLLYTEAGYTHYVSYKEWKETLGDLGDYMYAGFPTTQDALAQHLKSIKSRDTVQLEVFPL